MAQRRMTSLEVIDTDAFLDMPQSSQLLYFHLNARADDDGFVSNPKRVMRDIGSQSDDLKVLSAKKFIIPFEDGICVIKHWRINNFIRKDIYKETKYLNLKNTLFIRPNGAYTLTDDGKSIPIPKGHFKIEDVDEALTSSQLRLDKSSIVKVSKEIVASDTPFSLKEEIKKLEENPRREMNIIALYFEYRKPDLQNKEQYSQALKRHLKPAIALKSFTDQQIIKAIDYAKKEYKDIYTLETLLKILVK